MGYSSKEAAELLQALVAASHACLDHLKIPHTPAPFRNKAGELVQRTRPWRTRGGPEGVAFHYTGGMSGIKSLRWFNDPTWGNADSSAHALIFDRMTPELDLWAKQEAAAVFHVPTLIIADLTQSTWATNWANARCLGVENRNGGTTKYDEEALRKPRSYICGRWWEPYTREQMVANVLLGRIFRALRGDNIFKPEWVVGHSMIWATKSDPGPMFPLHLVRRAIWDDTDVHQLRWISKFPQAPQGEGEDEAAWYEPTRESRADPPKTEDAWDAVIKPGSPPPAHTEDLTLWLADVLYRLGWPAGPEVPPDDQLRCFVSYYQRSTLAYKKDSPEKVLSVDGIAGPLTRESMKARVSDLCLL